MKNEGLKQKSLIDTDSRRMKNNGSLDFCYNVQSVVDTQKHFIIDISTTNDINDQNQLYIMAKDAADLLDVENPEVLADTGYYNGTEIKNCVDDGMKVYIKKARGNNSTNQYEFRIIRNSIGKGDCRNRYWYCRSGFNWCLEKVHMSTISDMPFVK